MVRLGELWECQAITVADEHLATSICQRVLVRLVEALSARRIPQGSLPRVLLAGVEGQHHTLGLRMIADVLEGAGYEVLYLGGDVPVESLRSAVAQHRPAVTGLGFGIAADVSALADSLWAIHELSLETRVVLGGRAVPPGLRSCAYPWVASSVDAVAAVETALASPPQAWPDVLDLLRSAEPRRSSAPPQARAVTELLAEAADEVSEVARQHLRRAASYRVAAFEASLTNPANHREFADELSTLTQDPAAAGAVLLIDVDGFRAVNDRAGDHAGDRLLRTIGQAISSALGPGDVVARIGGDEFAVLLPGATPEAAQTTSERIRAAVSACAKPPVTVSVGMTALAGNARGRLLAAHAALYEAKSTGRDRVVGARAVS